MSRPEYIRCIQHTHAEKLNTSWCGKSLYRWDKPFQDTDHALYTVMNGDRLLPCSECAAKIIELLEENK